MKDKIYHAAIHEDALNGWEKLQECMRKVEELHSAPTLKKWAEKKKAGTASRAKKDISKRKKTEIDESI